MSTIVESESRQRVLVDGQVVYETFGLANHSHELTFRDGESQVQHTRGIVGFTDADKQVTCTFTLVVTYVDSQLRHELQDVECTSTV
jgi:hypothetical protein